MQKLGKTWQQTLQQYLRHLGSEHTVLGYHELQGLLYAMCCAPEPVASSEWFSLVWLRDEPAGGDDSATMDLVAFRHLLVELRQHIASAARQGEHLPFVPAPDDDQLTGLAGWCDGFLLGHHHLESLWDQALSGLADRGLERVVSRCLIAAGRLAGWQLGHRRPLEGHRQTLHCYRRLRRGLRIYHSVHVRWQGLPDRHAPERRFQQLQPVAAGADCLCGSGRRFGQCCLH